ncbi:MAG: NAD(P)-dependent oxidoreductase, partial [Tepidisphaeraceae bacterium]
MPQLLVDTNVDPSLLEPLQQSTGLSVAMAPGALDTARELPESLLADVQATLCSFLPTNHAAMKSLKLVQLCSAGFSQVENLGLAARGVAVCNASGVNDVPIAEWAITMMVALARDLPLMLRNQQQGLWDRGARFQTEIRGRTLGIWGYGGIGRETARLASGMGLRVHVL